MGAMNKPPAARLPRAYYYAPIRAFLASDDERILGVLAAHSDMSVTPAQRDAWLEEITILKRSLVELDGMLFLECNIPRMGKRIDAVVVVKALVAVIEFKVGEETYTRGDINQVWYYALDLKNFMKPVMRQRSYRSSLLPTRRLTQSSCLHGTMMMSMHQPRRTVQGCVRCLNWAWRLDAVAH